MEQKKKKKKENHEIFVDARDSFEACKIL